MNKKMLILFSFLAIISCNYEIVNRPGLKGRIKKVVDYKIRIDNDNDNDSDLGSMRDTFSISTSKFNKKGQIIETDIFLHYAKSVYKGTNVYDSKGQIIKEIGLYDNNEIVVDYEYNDTLIHRTHSKNDFDGMMSEMNEKYYYNEQQKLIKREYYEISIDQKSMDTVSINEFVYNYDSDERLTESTMKMWSVYDSLITTRNKFDYNEIGLLIRTNEFNEQDRLIETEIYKYDFDKNGSWIIKETYENDTLKYINTRTIEYK